METENIILSSKLIASIKKRASKAGLTFEDEIKNHYQFEANTCKVFYEDLQGNFFQKANGEKLPIEKEEFKLYSALNPDGKVILLKHASLGPIEERI